MIAETIEVLAGGAYTAIARDDPATARFALIVVADGLAAPAEPT